MAAATAVPVSLVWVSEKVAAKSIGKTSTSDECIFSLCRMSKEKICIAFFVCISGTHASRKKKNHTGLLRLMKHIPKI
jgi:hypothetical protein